MSCLMFSIKATSAADLFWRTSSGYQSGFFFFHPVSSLSSSREAALSFEDEGLW